jgi:F0F1-type ATP synthase assembly protein I
MNVSRLQSIRPLLLISAIVGFLVVNVPFLYFAVIDRVTYTEAITNGMALVFIGEAFLLMLFIAFLIARLELKRPGWVFFVVMSLLGSMAFSIPLQLYLILSRTKNSGSESQA